MGKSRVLGEVKEVQPGQGLVRYREAGNGEPVVFVHELLVNGDHWHDVMPPLAERFRCVVPDLPLGSRVVSMDSDADLSPPRLAWLVADFLAALKLRDVALVGNDTGATCQLVVARHPERIARLVLTNCDAFENFLPPLLRPFQYGARVPGFASLVARLLRTSLGQRLIISTVARRRPEPEIPDSYLAPITRDAGVRRYVNKFLRDISNRYTSRPPRRSLPSASRFCSPGARTTRSSPCTSPSVSKELFQTRSSSGSPALAPSSPRISRGCWPSSPRLPWSHAHMSRTPGNPERPGEEA